MKRGAALCLALLLLAACAPRARKVDGPVSEAVEAALESGTEAFDHGAWGELLAAGTRDGLVDYRLFQERRADLDAYLGRIASADLASLQRDELMALLINAYNALTVRSILDHPHVRSIREIPGVWDTARHRVGGYELTLDEIEHRILRPFFRDPRVHFALNCASRSCAPLPPWALDGGRLDAQLAQLESTFLTDPANVRLEGDTLLLPRTFDWFAEDFTGEGWRGAAPSVAGYVRGAALRSVAGFIEDHRDHPPVAFLDYDWSLNAAVAPDPTVRPAAGAGAGGTGGGLISRVRSWVEGAGAFGPMLFVLFYIAATVAFVPGSALTAGAGVLFGVVAGTALVSVGSTVGASLAFLLGRTLLRRRVEGWVEGNERFASIDRAVSREGWKIVALTRLSPFFPFNLQNYAYGLTGVGFASYVLASWIAMLPGTVLYVYIGAAAADVADAATGAGARWELAFKVIGLLATLGVTVYLTRIARRALQEAAGAAH